MKKPLHLLNYILRENSWIFFDISERDETLCSFFGYVSKVLQLESDKI